MLKPSINDVLDKIDNRYYLVTTVAKRAREIIDGAEPYVVNKNKEIKPVSLATQEVAEGEIHFRILTEEEVNVSEVSINEDYILDEVEVISEEE
jgi:DNA-directed RNA polymerase subunit omega